MAMMKCSNDTGKGKSRGSKNYKVWIGPDFYFFLEPPIYEWAWHGHYVQDIACIDKGHSLLLLR